MGATVEVRGVRGRSDLDRFVKFPWRIYRSDPHWIPPLLSEVKRALDPKRHPFHDHAEVETFLAWRGGHVVGRIAAIHNRLYNEFHDDQTGFFGLFECVDDEAVATALLAAAEEWLRVRGLRSALGPMNFSTNEEIASPGVLISGRDTPPKFMMSHSPAYYAPLLERAGYSKTRDLLSYWLDAEQTPERLRRAMERLQRTEHVRIRPIELKVFAAELERIKKIYNAAWEKNWGFVPMTDREFDFMAKSLRPVVDPRMVLIAEVDGEPIGFAVQLPDLNQPLKKVNGRLFPFGIVKFLWYRRKIDSVRVLTLGVLPRFRGKGIDALMVAKLMEISQPLNLARGECSWVLEDNLPMRNAMQRFGAHVYKTYRVYEKAL